MYPSVCVCVCVFVRRSNRMCVSACVCDEHLTAKDLRSHESILLMRVLELWEEGYKPLTLFFQFVFPSFPTFFFLPHSLPLPLSGPHGFTPFWCFHSSLSLSLRFSLFPPLLEPTSRCQEVVTHTTISSSQMHFAPLLHYRKLNIPSKTSFSRSGDISCSAPMDLETQREAA